MNGSEISSGGKKKRILFIVEGERTEPLFVHRMFEAFGFGDTHDVVSVRTNVHELLVKLKRDYGDDIESVDLQAALGEYLPDERSRLVLEGSFTDIFLLFDFDPQDNRLDIDTLRTFQRTYSDSTDLGQLYINYPSIEAYRDFDSFDDRDFLDTAVPLADISHGHMYKTLVGSRQNGLDNLTRVTGPQFAAIAAMHASKVQHLVGNVPAGETIRWAKSEDLAEAVTGLDLDGLLQCEESALAHDGMIPTCCTACFFASSWPRYVNGAWRKWLHTEG